MDYIGIECPFCHIKMNLNYGDIIPRDRKILQAINCECNNSFIAQITFSPIVKFYMECKS